MWMQFFTTEPYPCEPSSLPKYPPSKELDVKLREEEARRLRVSLSWCFTIFWTQCGYVLTANIYFAPQAKRSNREI